MEASSCTRRAANWNCSSQASFSNSLPKPKRLCSNAEKINSWLLIPAEVVEEILLRLPAESLVVCKRVCKSWFNLINDPSFVNKHLLRVTNEHHKMKSLYPRTFLLKWVRQELSLDYIFAPHRYHLSAYYGNSLSVNELSLVTVCDSEDDGGNGDYLPCVVEHVSLPPLPVTNNDQDSLPPLPLTNEDHFRLPTRVRAFHCNGIIHMFDEISGEVAILLNPVLREFKLLQTRYPLLEELSRFDPCSFSGSGFGYDPKANVYKYVAIYPRRSFSLTRTIAVVHTMGTDHSSWRVINIDLEGNSLSIRGKGVYCKGAYFWWNDHYGKHDTVLSFDMSEEKFRTITLPHDLCQRVSKRRKQLELWKESVCFFLGLECSWFSSTFEMWVMVDNFGGVEGAIGWTKHLTIGPLVCIAFPLAFWRDDELLMEGFDGRIVSYNIYTQKFRRVPLPGAVLPDFTLASLCLNSLVSV